MIGEIGRRGKSKFALPADEFYSKNDEEPQMNCRLIFLSAFLFLSVCHAGAQTGAEKSLGGATAEEDGEFISEVQPAAFKRNLSAWGGVWLTQKDKEAVAMNAQDAARFAEFLRQEDAGFVRLYDASTCETNLRVLNVADECPPNISGRGVFYSFRKKKYQTGFFSDVKFHKSSLQATGLNVLGFLVDLGDEPLEKLTLESGGVREMSAFAPPEELDKIKSQFRAVHRGFQIGDFLYKSALPLKENNTYALRAVAYQGKVLGRFGRFKFNVLSNDKRQDVIIAFRVIRKHSNGSVSLLWRELQRKPAPKLEFKKEKNKK
jgi:hypothetical protein